MKTDESNSLNQAIKHIKVKTNQCILKLIVKNEDIA